MVQFAARNALLGIALAAVAAAQVTVSGRKGNAPRGEIERRIEQLADPDTRSVAMHALWRDGPHVVPLLAAEVTRGGASAGAALSVLEALGGEAAPAGPVLRRALESAEEPFASRMRRLLAILEGSPRILVSRHKNDEIVEVDLEGTVVRRVACESPWGVWPLPDDQIGAISFARGARKRLHWDGRELESEKILDTLTSVRELPDGGRITTAWSGAGLVCVGVDGETRWEKKLRAMRCFVHLDEILVVTRDDNRLYRFSFDGRELAALPLPEMCSMVQPLPSGNFLLASQSSRIVEINREGEVIATWPMSAPVNSLFRLRDGRTIAACEDGLFLLDRNGEQVWAVPEFRYCGPLFVRAPW